MSDKWAAISLLGFKVRGIQMEFAIEVIDSVDCPRMLSLALIVPLYPKPDVTAGLGVVKKLSSVPNASKDRT